jgi:hypothetical protein
VRNLIDHVCQRAACGKAFQSRQTDSKYCGPACAQEMRRVTYPERKCRNCGTTYRPHRGNRNKIYCKHACANAHRRKPQVVCDAPGCEVTFTQKDSSSRFCSRKCAVPNQRRRSRGRDLPDYTCANPSCGKVFRPGRKEAKFCSIPCSAAGQVRSGGVSPRLPNTRCAHAPCGRMFHPPNSRAKYCSRDCVHAAMRKSERKAEQDPAPKLPPPAPPKIDIPPAPKQPERPPWRPAGWSPQPMASRRAS